MTATKGSFSLKFNPSHFFEATFYSLQDQQAASLTYPNPMATPWETRQVIQWQRLGKKDEALTQRHRLGKIANPSNGDASGNSPTQPMSTPWENNQNHGLHHKILKVG